jgi:hypothetical protein
MQVLKKEESRSRQDLGSTESWFFNRNSCMAKQSKQEHHCGGETISQDVLPHIFPQVPQNISTQMLICSLSLWE